MHWNIYNLFLNKKQKLYMIQTEILRFLNFNDQDYFARDFGPKTLESLIFELKILYIGIFTIDF